MQRREFLRNSTLSATGLIIGGALSSAGFSTNLNQEPISLNQSLLLKGFQDEQEEYPSLVSDWKGNMWIHSLRRIAYPENTELVSSFHFNGEKWVESEPVTQSPGRYEAPISACALGGLPIVAWTTIKEGKWEISVAQLSSKGYEQAHTFFGKSGRAINPVLLAAHKNRNWIAWENLLDGKFTIFISKYDSGIWSEPIHINKSESSCFNPAMAEAKNGDLYLAYGYNQGYHQNIEMMILDGKTLKIKKKVPIALGGGLKNRANINSKAALAFDALDRLWISYENNRFVHRLDDGDNYTGDRCCAILSYKNGKIVEIEKTGKWLFSGKNDHKPTFVKDNKGHLYIATHCGGDFVGNPHWQYRLSWLDPQKGWAEPQTIIQTKQKGALIPPAIAFDKNNQLWFTTCIENRFKDGESEKPEEVVRSLLTQLTVQQFTTPELNGKYTSLKFKNTKVKEFLPGDEQISTFSGHPKVSDEQINVNGEVYTLVYGNLHEHSENSPCWPAGTDGTLHEDYRFGMFTENYDFVGITDHGYSLTEVYWRKSLRLADFYNEPGRFIALPAMEWTLRSNKDLDGIQYGAGHYNVIFASAEESKKFIRNEQEIYNVYTPETNNSVALWKFLDSKNIDCISIPHHPADETHPVDWDVHDEKYVPVVELFQCRGNSEYPGCPREFNLERHRTTKHKRAFVDYALKEKKYKMGFVSSGDHNGMGVGVAALWVKELSRDGILEAMRSKRCFATTGDKMIVDFRINGETTGSVVKINKAPQLNIAVKGQRELAKVEILRDSEVIKTFIPDDGTIEFNNEFMDENHQNREGVYYYTRATQKNKEIAWSSPVWVEKIS